MSWVGDHLKTVLTIIAALGLVIAGARWVWGAEQEHQAARSVAELVKQNAEIIQKQQKQLETKDALEEQKRQIKRCLLENPGAHDFCIQ